MVEDRGKEVARLLSELFRVVEPRKIAEVTALLPEVSRLTRGHGGSRPRLLVDLACGKSYVLHALAALERPRARYLFVERDPALLAQCERAAKQLGMDATFFAGSIDTAPLPRSPDLVLALHACGEASDRVIERALAAQARHLLLVPCCHARPTRDAFDGLGFPRQGVLRGRLADTLTDARRTLRLEAAGYEVVASEFVPLSVTKQNLLLRARRVGETGRAEWARASLERLSSLGAPP